jgi:lipoate-protein ligase A
MLYISRTSTDPYFNIAAEEYFLKFFKQDIFMLWQNTPSIILGKHQNTLAEINLDFIRSNNIPVIRRISGGGTVFHDLGNLNFTFIKNGKKGKLVNFKEFTNPIINALDFLGITAQLDEKNDLRINGLKISGNAEHIHKNRVLHHGTLLFSSDLSYLNKTIKSNVSNFHDKAIKSNRSTVANIIDHLDKKISIENFKNSIRDYMFSTIPDIANYKLKTDDINAIHTLADEKYKSWQWNYGYSPKYNFKQSITISEKKIYIEIEVKGGIIQKIEFKGNRSIVNQLNSMKKCYIGKKHDKEELIQITHNCMDQKLSSKIDIKCEDIINGMF